MNQNELDLIQAAQRGNRQAFGELFHRHGRMVRGLVRLTGSGGIEVDDLVQEIFLEAWRALPRLREPMRFLPWLRGIARNCCRSARRRSAKGPELREVETLAIQSPVKAGVEELLSLLPEDCSLVLREKFCEDRTYKEIARRHRLTVAQVRGQMEKGLRLVAQRLTVESRKEAQR
ncbi:MAG: sigma-70 family RNA polymerase sigma factor [Planctomycetota bacterium]